MMIYETSKKHSLSSLLPSAHRSSSSSRCCRIKRYHIKQVTQQKSSSFASTNGPDDDLYDF
jgi:hypothetical protein